MTASLQGLPYNLESQECKNCIAYWQVVPVAQTTLSRPRLLGSLRYDEVEDSGVMAFLGTTFQLANSGTAEDFFNDLDCWDLV